MPVDSVGVRVGVRVAVGTRVGLAVGLGIGCRVGEGVRFLVGLGEGLEVGRLYLLLNYQRCWRLSDSDHLVCSGCPSLPAIGRQLPSGSGREVEPFGATVVLFTLRLHIGIDAWVE